MSTVNGLPGGTDRDPSRGFDARRRSILACRLPTARPGSPARSHAPRRFRSRETSPVPAPDRAGRAAAPSLTGRLRAMIQRTRSRWLDRLDSALAGAWLPGC
jgi:hypothetical protein